MEIRRNFQQNPLDLTDAFCLIENHAKFYYICYMLTKTDLNQITKIVQKETTNIVRRETVKIVKSEVVSLEMKMNKRFDKLEGKLDYAINFMHRDFLKLKHRVERIEEHLNLEPASI